MAVYGYRIFTVQLYAGMTQTPLGFDKCGADHYSAVAAGLLRGMRGETLIDDSQRAVLDELPAPGEVIDATPEVEDQASPRDPFAGKKALFVDVLAEDTETLYGEMLVGTFGDHELALSAPQLVEVDPATDKDTEKPRRVVHADLKGTAPARRYRFILNVPADDKVGILIVEDISRGCPVDLLVKWLNRRSQALAAEALAVRSEPPKPRDRPMWWRIKHLPAVDEDHFRLMIARGQLEKVELVKHAVTAGGNRTKVGLRLTAPRPAENVVSELVQLVGEWVDEKKVHRVGSSTTAANGKPPRLSKQERIEKRESERQNRSQSDAAGARAVAAILGEKIEQIGFDDGWLVLKDGGRGKRISPSRLSELFTYQLDTDRRPSNVAFYAAARTKVLSLHAGLQLKLEWPESIDMEGDGSVQLGPSESSSTAEGALEVSR